MVRHRNRERLKLGKSLSQKAKHLLPQDPGRLAKTSRRCDGPAPASAAMNGRSCLFSAAIYGESRLFVQDPIGSWVGNKKLEG